MIFKTSKSAMGAALLICLAAPAFPQTGTGIVRGTVFDSARAAVPNAKVVLTHASTNVARQSATNELGIYVFTSVPLGRYRLTAELQGFKKWSADLELTAGQTAVLEPVLEVGSEIGRASCRERV